MNIGLLALQGDYEAHREVLHALGATTTLVRTPEQLNGIDGLVIPGGESTVMSRLSDRYGLRVPLTQAIENGLPVLGTCAGLIFLARDIEGATENFAQKTLRVLDVQVARNAYGAQNESFETDLNLTTTGESIHAVFIRAPQILKTGEAVEVLASHEGAPVLVRQNQIMAAAFHPEIVGEHRVHQLWLQNAGLINKTAQEAPTSR